jgi:hypothetical protein
MRDVTEEVRLSFWLSTVRRKVLDRVTRRSVAMPVTVAIIHDLAGYVNLKLCI